MKVGDVRAGNLADEQGAERGFDVVFDVELVGPDRSLALVNARVLFEISVAEFPHEWCQTLCLSSARGVTTEGDFGEKALRFGAGLLDCERAVGADRVSLRAAGCVSVLDDERFLSSAGDPQSEPGWVDAPDEGLAPGFASCRVDASFRESLPCCLRVEYS
jgi:hypothetical protein